MIAEVQRQIHAIYDTEAPDVRAFLLDAAQVEALAGGLRPNREWVLVRQEGEDVDLGVFLHPEDLDAIERLGPRGAVREALGAWTRVVEGVSHFVLLVHRAVHAAPVSMLELEMQAEVDKYVTARLLGGSASTVHRRLFVEARLQEQLDPEEEERYREAARLAARFCAALERLPHVDAWLDSLRRFYRAPDRLGRLRRAA